MLVPRVPPEAPGTSASAPRGGRAARRLAAALTLAALVLGGGGVDAGEAGLHAERGHALPLGPRGLPEERFEQQVSPGVRYTRIVRGEQSARDFYTVDVAFRA